MIALLIGLSVLGIFVNAVFIVTCRVRSDTTQTIQVFLYNLGASNVLSCLLCLTWDIAAEFALTSGTWQCYVQFYGLQLTLYSTLGTVSVMGMERIIAIRRPFLYKSIFTARRRKLLIAGIWSTALVFSCLASGDFIAGLHGYCTALNLYPTSYGVFIVAVVLALYLVSGIGFNGLLIYSFFKYVPGLPGGRMGHAALRATGITIACCVAYVLTVTPLVAFFIYTGITTRELQVVLLEPFSISVNAILILVTLVDPLVYFVSMCVCGSRKRSQVSSCGNQPLHQEQDNRQEGHHHQIPESGGGNNSYLDKPANRQSGNALRISGCSTATEDC